MAKKSATSEVIVIKPIELVTATIHIEGTSPLIMHAWDSKAKQMMLDKMQKKTVARSIRNPVEDFINSMYWLTPMPEEMTEEAFVESIHNGAEFGFPVDAFKEAAISGAYRRGWTKDKVSLRGVFFIQSDSNTIYARDGAGSRDMVRIKSDAPIIREDCVKVGMGTTDLRYRGEFRNWSADLQITYDVNGVYSLDQIIQFINIGGWSVGVGEWRPEKGGQYGMFKVV